MLIQTWAPGVLVSDIEMPNEDGHVLMRKVRQLGVSHPIVAIAATAHARPEDRVRALEVGFQWHLAKPIEPSELISVIASVALHPVAFNGLSLTSWPTLPRTNGTDR